MLQISGSKKYVWEKLKNGFGKNFQNVLPDKIWSLFRYQKQFARFVDNAEKELKGNFLLIPDKILREKYFLGKFRRVESQMKQNSQYIEQLQKEKPKTQIDRQAKELRIELLRQQNNSLFAFTLIKLKDIYSDVLKESIKVNTDKNIQQIPKGKNGKHKTTLARHQLYSNRFKELSKKENLSTEKAIAQVCKEYGISPKTFERAIKNSD